MTDQPRIAPAPDVAAKVVDGEAVLIHLTTGAYYSLENVAGRIWELIDGGVPPRQIVEVVAGEYQAPVEQVRADLDRLLDELRREELVRETDEGAASEVPDSTRPPSAPLEYQPPALNVYRDMADLFALDPPLPELKDEWRDRDETQS
jgi:Coenzyme PQQ synthesis protein D (PqqD)